MSDILPGMTKSSVERIFIELNDAGVKYLVVGGLAVNAHGYFRATVDVDLILGFDRENLVRAVEAIKRLGYAPRAPVPIEAFADADARASWRQQKGMLVFSLHSSRHPETEVDLFVEDPIGFDVAYAKCARMEIAPGLSATFCSLDDLLRMKRAAGRAQDRLDVQKLSELHPDK